MLKFGARVRDITLMLLGGLAQTEKIPEKPSQELRIAIAGPLVGLLTTADVNEAYHLFSIGQEYAPEMGLRK